MDALGTIDFTETEGEVASKNVFPFTTDKRKKYKLE